MLWFANTQTFIAENITWSTVYCKDREFPSNFDAVPYCACFLYTCIFVIIGFVMAWLNINIVLLQISPVYFINKSILQAEYVNVVYAVSYLI